jgi:hypothetical protein
MPTLVIFDEFGSDLGKGVHVLNSHTLRVAFTNSAPNQATGATISDITQIAGTGGYTAQALDSVTWSETSAGSGVWRLSSADEVFTATGADFAPFRYVVLYNDTPTSPADPLIAYLDYGSAVTVTNGNTFTVDVGASGWFEFTIP